MEKKCCFTGHRNIRQSDEIAIKSRVKAQVASAIKVHLLFHCNFGHVEYNRVRRRQGSRSDV